MRERAGLETREGSFDGVYLRFGHRPGPGRPLLLCNGIGANLELALPLLQALGRRPVIIVDVPGTGGSPSTFLRPHFKVYARLLVSVVDHLGYGGQFDLAGVSWGGGLAQQIAFSQSARVSHLVLMATSPGVVMMPGQLNALWRMATPQRYLSRRYMARHAGTLYGGAMRQRGELMRQHARLTQAPSVLGYTQQLACIAQFSSLPWLHRIGCPSLILSGDDDPLIHPLNARLMGHLIPNAQTRILPGAGHLFMVMQPRRTAALIDDFLSAARPERSTPTINNVRG